MTAPRRFLELVLILWVDSEASVGWDSGEDAPLVPVKSIGFLVSQDGEKYVLAADYDTGNEHFNRKMVIPKECVRTFRQLTILPLQFK